MKLKFNFYAQSVINYLLKNGIGKSKVYKLINIKNGIVDPMEHELTIEHIHNLTMYLKEKFDVEHCGLELVNFLNFQNTGFFGSYALSCSTLFNALTRIYAVHKEVNTVMTYEMIPAEKPYIFKYNLERFWEAKYPESAKDIVEFAMANGLNFSRRLTKQNIVPRQVRFKYKKPADVFLYKEIFQCDLDFEQDENEIVYQMDVMDIKIPTFNPGLLEILDDFAKKTIREQTNDKSFVTVVRTLIIKSSHTKIPLESEIAFQLNMSKRTLQKKLYEKGTTFKKILEQVLKELAISYIKSDKSSNKEIAWLLGYNDISNFHRAFKRWTGSTPNEFRNVSN